MVKSVICNAARVVFPGEIVGLGSQKAAAAVIMLSGVGADQIGSWKQVCVL